jgi:superoxide oxidase
MNTHVSQPPVARHPAAPIPSPGDRYAPSQMALHWLMAALLVAVFACIELRVLFAKGSDPREALKAWHFALGMVVPLALALRLLLRLARPAPAIVPPLAMWQQLAAGAMHVALYVWMFAMPLAGWLLRSAEGHDVSLLGMPLPPLTDPDKAFAKDVKHWHELAGTVGYWLIGLHVAAAAVHHLVQRDNTLLRMLPGRRGRVA